MCDTFMLPPGKRPRTYSGKHHYGSDADGAGCGVHVFGWSKLAASRPDIEFTKSRLPKCLELLGCYRPEEHIDNPTGLPDHRVNQYPKGWLVDLPVDKRMLKLIRPPACAAILATLRSQAATLISCHMQRQLRRACQLGKHLKV